MKSARIVFLDIETAPSLGWVWGKWEQNVIEFQRNWYMLSFAYKWLDEPGVTVRALCDYPDYKDNVENDAPLIYDLWEIYNAADIVVAHNGDSFDIKKSNARFITHNLPPPSPYKTIDTLKIAKKHFSFESNKLGDLGQYLEIGGKLPHTGFRIWKGCMIGDPASWATMKEYNAQDVLLLEQVYLKLRPWAPSHPDLNLYSHASNCPACQSSKVQRRGFSYAKTIVKQRFNCTECGHWWSGKAIKKGEGRDDE